MKRLINITQFASGSRTDNIGDTTLFYTSGFSKHANDLAGLFLDNPPVLSRDYATLIWRYYQDVDKHILIHVQGSHVVSSAMGRNYPFRAGYEVSRDDMNSIEYRLSSLFNAMPRISALPSGRVEAAKEIDVTASYTNRASECLAEQILNAITEKKRLFISIDVNGTTYRNDGVFSAQELQIMLSAIESLPLQLRRYVSFGFCVDENHSTVLDEVLVVVYVKGSKLLIPHDAILLSWYEAISKTTAFTMDDKRTLSRILLPGADSPILSMNNFFKALTIHSKDPSQLKGEEWSLWLSLGHHLEDVSISNWVQFKKYYETMDSPTQDLLAQLHHGNSLHWPVDNLDAEMTEVMNYKEKELFSLQCKTLASYLSSRQYSFLFKDGLSPELKKELNASFLDRLNLKDKDSVERWYQLFLENDALASKETLHQFGVLLGRYGAMQMTTLEEMIPYMGKYPFIPAAAFNMPKQVYLPKEMSTLSAEHQKLIDQWVKSAIDNVSLSSIDDVLKVMDTAQKDSDGRTELEELSLKEMKVKELCALLLQEHTTEKVIDHCEDLMEQSCLLPASWHDQVVGKFLPAVDVALFSSDGILKKEFLLDVSKWPNLTALCKSRPYFKVLLMNRLNDLFMTASKKTLSENIKNTYVKKKAEITKNNNTVIGYKQKADEAFPIIHQFITTTKNQDKKMAKDFEKLFKDLKGAKQTQNKTRRLFIHLLCGALLGVLLTIGAYFGVLRLLKNRSVKNSGASIEWVNNNHENLMLRLADLSEWDYISKIQIDTFLVNDLKIGKTADLLKVNNRFYQSSSTKEPDKAVVCVYQIDDQGMPLKNLPMDSLQISRENSLLSKTYNRKVRVGQVIVNDDIKIAIDHTNLFPNDTAKMSMLDAKYYFEVIKFIHHNLPKDLQIAY